MKRIEEVLFVAMLCGAAAPPVEWKAFADQKSSGIQVYSFYESTGVEHLPNHHVQVWTKTLTFDDIKKATTDADVRVAVQKVHDGYIPPAAADFDTPTGLQLAGITLAELVANNGEVPPKTQTLWEIDCQQRISRTLSLMVDGKSVSDTPSQWIHLPPQSNGENLMNLACK